MLCVVHPSIQSARVSQVYKAAAPVWAKVHSKQNSSSGEGWPVGPWHLVSHSSFCSWVMHMPTQVDMKQRMLQVHYCDLTLLILVVFPSNRESRLSGHWTASGWLCDFLPRRLIIKGQKYTTSGKWIKIFCKASTGKLFKKRCTLILK